VASPQLLPRTQSKSSLEALEAGDREAHTALMLAGPMAAQLLSWVTLRLGPV
jgi:hypothetical protein